MPMNKVNPPGYFGTQPTGAGAGASYQGPWTPGGQDQFGTGMRGLPGTFRGWNAAARYGFGPAMQYDQRMRPVAQFFQGEMNRDYGKELYGISSDIAETQFTEARRQGQQQMTRAGYGGGGAVSPMASLQLSQEAEARSGALGLAARQAVLQAQQMRMGAAQNLQNVQANRMQAMLTPAMMQRAGTARGPMPSMGPSLVGPAQQFAQGAAGY